MTVAEIGWFASAFHLDAEGTTSSYQYRYAELDARLRPARAQEDQGALEGDASQGVAGPCAGVGSVGVDSRRADLGPRRAGETGIPREHGRPGGRRPDGLAFEPPDRRGGARGQPRGPAAPRETGPGRAAGGLEGTDVLAVGDVSQPRPCRPAPGGTIARIDRRVRRGTAGALAGARSDRAACEIVRALPGVESLEIETPSLEEIYIGYMRARRPEPVPPLAVHVA